MVNDTKNVPNILEHESQVEYNRDKEKTHTKKFAVPSRRNSAIRGETSLDSLAIANRERRVPSSLGLSLTDCIYLNKVRAKKIAADSIDSENQAEAASLSQNPPGHISVKVLDDVNVH